MEKGLAFQPHKIKQLRALHDSVIVSDMAFDERISNGGIIIPNDDMKNSGIRPRWGRVYAIGPDQTDIDVGQYVLVSHGRWTRGVDIEDDNGKHTIRKVDTNDILMVSDEPVQDSTMSDKVI
jgi:co-chaperonin GroES (HSP10)